MRWLTCFAAALIACGRISFDARIDGAPSDASQARACPWTTPTVGSVVSRDDLNTTGQEADPLLVRGDPLTMYFARAGADFDIYVAHRPSTAALFDPPQAVAELANPGVPETAMQVDTSGHGFYVRNKAPSNTDIFELQRNPAGTYVEVRGLTELDTGANELDPVLSADGLTLWYTAGAAAVQHIYMASRASTIDPWSGVTSFERNSSGIDGAASLTSDGLVVLWTSAAGIGTQQDIYFAVRATTADAWGPAQLLAPGLISTSANELEPSIREDGCEVFFARSPSPTNFNWDFYSATLQ